MPNPIHLKICKIYPYLASVEVDVGQSTQLAISGAIYVVSHCYHLLERYCKGAKKRLVVVCKVEYSIVCGRLGVAVGVLAAVTTVTSRGRGGASLVEDTQSCGVARGNCLADRIRNSHITVQHDGVWGGEIADPQVTLV